MKSQSKLPVDAKTFPLPYYAVIFISTLNKEAQKVQPNYAEVAKKMLEFVKKEDGFLGMDSARSELGITVSYWSTLEAIQS